MFKSIVYCFSILALLYLAISNKKFRLSELYLGEPIVEKEPYGLKIVQHQTDPFSNFLNLVPLVVETNTDAKTNCKQDGLKIFLNRSCEVFIPGKWRLFEKKTVILARPNILWFILVGFCLLFVSCLVSPKILLILGFTLAAHAYFYVRPGNLIYYPTFLAVFGLLALTKRYSFSKSQPKRRILIYLTIVSALLFTFLKLVSLERFSQWSYHPDEKNKIQQTRVLDASNKLPDKLLHPPLMIKSFILGRKILKGIDEQTVFRVVQGLYILVGLLAIALLCFKFFHVEGFCLALIVGFSSILLFVSGNYLKEDAPLFCFSSLGYLMVLSSKNLNHWRLGVALIFCWLAASSKYPGLITLASVAFLAIRMGSSPVTVFGLSIFTGLVVLAFVAPEIIFNFSAVFDGFLYEVTTKLGAESGFRYPAIDFFLLYGFFKTYFLFENPIFAVLVIFGTNFLFRNFEFKNLFYLFLIHYLTFELNDGKPPQTERYFLMTYPFLIIGIVGCACNYSLLKSLVLSSSFINFFQLVFISFSDLSPEKKIAEYLCSQRFENVIHSRHLLRAPCDLKLRSLKRENLNDFYHLNLIPGETAYVTTYLHHYIGYIEARVAPQKANFGLLLFGLARKLKFRNKIGNRIFQKVYINNVYYIYDLEKLNFETLLKKLNWFYLT